MKDQADVNHLRFNRLAKIEKVLLGRVREEECALQATPNGGRVLLSSLKKSFPVGIREPEVDAQMVQAETSQSLSIKRRVGNSTRGGGQADLWDWSRRRTSGDDDLGSRFFRSRNCSMFDDQAENEALTDLFAGAKLHGKGEFKWSAVRLEGSVGPISLVFHFKDLAFQCDVRLDPIGGGPCERPNVLQRLMWRNEPGERLFFPGAI